MAKIDNLIWFILVGITLPTSILLLYTFCTMSFYFNELEIVAIIFWHCAKYSGSWHSKKRIPWFIAVFIHVGAFFLVIFMLLVNTFITIMSIYNSFMIHLWTDDNPSPFQCMTYILLLLPSSFFMPCFIANYLVSRQAN